jgi:stage II sporulation protein M
MTEARKTLDDHIREAFQVVSKSRRYIVLAVVIFSVSIVVGAVMHERFTELLKYLTAFAKSMKDQSATGIILGIFQKNFIAMLVVIVGGIAFGVIPVFSLVVNGAVLGVAMMAALQKGLSIFALIAAILPHGMFELPAIFIASGVGMRIGFMQLKHNREPARKRMAEGLQVLFFVVLPLLIVAAIIEGLGIAYLR